jgi:hypothetical protein
MYLTVPQLTLRAGVRSCQRLSRLFSNQSSQLSTISPSSPSTAREELHRLALLQNQKHHKLQQSAFDAETNIAMTTIPRDIRFDQRDSIELRDWKRRQQHYYSIEQKYGFLNDTLAKLGILQQRDVDEKKEWVKQRLKSQKWISDESRKTSVSLRALALVQQEYGVPSAMLIDKQDTPEQKQQKVKEQIQFWVKQTSESLDGLPHDRKTVSAGIKEAKQANRMNYKVTQEDIDLFLLEHEEELKTELEWSDEKFMEYAILARKLAARESQEKTVDDLIKTGPLDKLQLIAPNTLEKVEHALKVASELMTKRAEEFEARFGGEMPLAIENDPYRIEYEAQLKFLKEKQAVAAIKAPEPSVAGAEVPDATLTGEIKTEENSESKATTKEAEEAGKEATGEEGGKEENKVPTTPGAFEEDLLFRSESDGEDPDAAVYAANRKPLTFMSSPQEDGEQWPRIVDGVDLTNPKIQRIREFDYDAFEEAPTALEVRIMDAFAVQRQLRDAKKRNITLVPRVHIPYTPADRSLIAKTLLMYRLQALRTHLDKLRAEAKVQYDREYRDISKLNLRVPFDPVNPWKQDVFDQVELVLKNQGNWTTGQKENCMIRLHRMLTDDTFSKANQDRGQL